MAEFGWSYISCGDVLTGSGGPEGAVQFKTPGGIDGSKDFIFDTGSGRVAIGVDWPNLDGKTFPDAALHVVGDVSVTGTIYATEYQILNVTRIEEEGSTKFGTSIADDHQFTGSVKIAGTLATDGNVTLGDAAADTVEVKGVLTASADVIVKDDLKLYFGTGKDASFEYDEDGNNVLLYAGASLRIDDDTTLQFGAGGDATIEYDENGTDELRFAGAAVTFEQAVTFDANMTLGLSNADIVTVPAQFTASEGLHIKDDRKLYFGDGSDASIEYDEDGTDELRFAGAAVTFEQAVTFDGNVTLGDAGTDVITLTARATASAGLMIPDATVQDDALQIGSGGDFFIAHDGTDTAISNATGKLKITSTVNTVDAIRLRANGGSSETIFIRADQGTSVMTDGNSDASIQLKSDDGGIGIRSTANLAASIQIEADGGANETIIVKADQSTVDGAAAAGAIQLLSDAGGIGLSWADGKDLWAEGGRAVVTANEDAADCIKLHADAGTSQTITVVNDAGTSATEGSAAIQLLASAGGINIKSSLNAANALLLTADGGTDETIVLHVDQGTGEGNGNASIELLSDAGGICFTATGLTGVMTNGNSDAAIQAHAVAGGIGLRSTANLEGCIQIEADGGANETVSIHSDQGTGVNAAGGSTDASINLISDAGGIGLYSAINAVNAITIEANGGTSENIRIHSNQGTSVSEGASSIQLLSDAGGVELKSAANLAKSIKLIADGGTSETIYIQSDQGTGADSIHLLSDAGGITLQVGSGKLVTVNGGHLVPSADNTLDLGGASSRWRNIYTGDLHLKNDRGDWTIVEESDYLSLRNNDTGKLYKFVLEEVDEE